MTSSSSSLPPLHLHPHLRPPPRITIFLYSHTYIPYQKVDHRNSNPLAIFSTLSAAGMNLVGFCGIWVVVFGLWNGLAWVTGVGRSSLVVCGQVRIGFDGCVGSLWSVWGYF